jgi:thioredoxin reductase (NADPH)
MTQELYDVVIIGAGPAGLQAAINSVRKKAEVLVLGRPERSSLYRAHIENYLAMDGVREGAELLAVGIDQVTRFGAEYIAEDVLHVEHNSETFVEALYSPPAPPEKN